MYDTPIPPSFLLRGRHPRENEFQIFADATIKRFWQKSENFDRLYRDLFKVKNSPITARWPTILYESYPYEKGVV